MQHHQLTEAEIAADKLEEMANELKKQAQMLRLEYGKPLDPERTIAFAFPRTKKTNKSK